MCQENYSSENNKTHIDTCSYTNNEDCNHDICDYIKGSEVDFFVKPDDSELKIDLTIENKKVIPKIQDNKLNYTSFNNSPYLNSSKSNCIRCNTERKSTKQPSSYIPNYGFIKFN